MSSVWAIFWSCSYEDVAYWTGFKKRTIGGILVIVRNMTTD